MQALLRPLSHLWFGVLFIALMATGAAAQSSYQIKPGDTVTIEVLEDETLNSTVIVLPDGRITFPRVGSVRASGRTVDQLQAVITAAIADDFAVRPNVFVSVIPLEEEEEEAEPVTINVYFLGEVNTPGLRELEPGVTFLQALSESGGLTQFAAEKRIQLRRTDPNTQAERVIEIDYRALSRGARFAQDIVLRDGDVILVPERRLFE